MKDKELEKLLKVEIKKNSPDVWNRIADKIDNGQNAIAPQLEPITVTNSNGKVNAKYGKKIAWFSGAVAVILAAILLLFILLPFGGIKFPEVGFAVIDINPSVQLVFDGGGKVKVAKPLNEDGRILLAQSNLIGLSAEDASVKIMEYSLELGYMKTTQKNNAMLISVELNDKKSSDKLSKSMKDALEKNVINKGIYCVVLNQTSEQEINSQAVKFNVSESKMRLILDARSAGAIIPDTEIGSISVTEIYTRMFNAAEELEDSLPHEVKEKYEAELEAAEELAEQLTERIEDIIETIEDETEDDEFAEQSLEKIEEILELIEDAAERGIGLDNLFLSLYNQLDELEKIVKGNAKSKVNKLRKEIEAEVKLYNTLKNEAATSIINTSKARQEHFKQQNESHAKDKDFDKQYKKWLKETAKEYEENWSSLKKAWENEN